MTEPMKHPTHTCDTCGAPAINFARDMAETTDPSADTDDWTPVGPLKKGCGEHVPSSIEYASLAAAAQEGKFPAGEEPKNEPAS